MKNFKYRIDGAKRIGGTWYNNWFQGQLTHMLQFADTKREADAICRKINADWKTADQYAYVEAQKDTL